MKTKNEILDAIIKSLLFDNYFSEYEKRVPPVIVRMTIEDIMQLKNK